MLLGGSRSFNRADIQDFFALGIAKAAPNDGDQANHNQYQSGNSSHALTHVHLACRD